jgi:excinuclease ABC subunit A
MTKRKKTTKPQKKTATLGKETTAREASLNKTTQTKDRKPGQVDWLTVVGARRNNLKSINVDVPLGRFVCVTGVSGSGKSSLVNDILREVLARDLNGAIKVDPGDHDRIDGVEHLDKLVDIDQTSIGRTPRSNPATYIKVFDEIRTLYTKLPDAKIRGYKPGRFSFNVATGKRGGGRCESCEGNGSNKLEMELLADVWVTCPVCKGRRFSHETLQILYKGKNIADVLNMDVQEALEHFQNVPRIAHMLGTLHAVGLDYMKLGQSSTTLSGGEAQRIKLARELVKKSTGRTIYLLDEPTTGLHFDDIKKLLSVLHGFVDAGNTVVVIEHNLDVIKTADWVIDLGPEGGSGGGQLVASGTPEQVAKSKTSFTGAAIHDQLTSQKNGHASTTKNQSPKSKHRASSDTRKTTNPKTISVVGARQHNLQNIDVEIPHGKMTVCCGPSGSGKSSFAIDTVYAEGQRRYVESLSSYARQFLGRLQPPKVDHVHGLSPAICIEQKNTSKSPRSTVGTVTEIYDYMRVLWTRIGKAHCPHCKTPIGTQSSEEIVERILALGEGTKLLLLAPVEKATNETYGHLFERERANGYARVRVDGVVHSLDESIDIATKRKHAVELVVDRIIVRKSQTSRLTDSVEQALAAGNGVLIAQRVEETKGETKKKTKRIAKSGDTRFSQHFACDDCGRSFDELTPHHFSFNTRIGWCDACEGLGVQQGASQSAIVIHPTRSIADGAIKGWGELTTGSKLHLIARALADHIGFELSRPWNSLTETQQLEFLQGCGDEWIELGASGRKSKSLAGVRFQWHGFFPSINRATRSSRVYRNNLSDLVTDVPCEVCNGGRLKPEPSAVRLGNATMHEVCLTPLGKTLDWFTKVKLDAREKKIAGEIMHEITSRLRFLVDVGLDYVSLHRTAATLSGGEAQRIQLASQIGTGLTGVLYVLDEPTIGLHPRDNHRLIAAMKRLRDLGNTLLLVEHDREVIDAANHVLDFGPGAGSYGGTVTAAASPAKLRTKPASLTGKYLSGKEAIPVPSNRRIISDKDRNENSEGMKWLTVCGARENNLREIDVPFPLSRFTCVTGVSGSGKSTLVSGILSKALAQRIHRATAVPGGHDKITGIEHVDKIINVDQSPIGTSPTSNPATYTGVFDAIRDVFAKLSTSKIRGYTANRFSFNRTGGRCEVCTGMGKRCIEMHFLPDVWIECEECGGKRYVPETLEVKFRGRSIADVLSMRIHEALEHFANVPKVRRMLKTLDDVGLGYLELGQSAPTLSGGEAQRVKLATELGKPSTGKTLYVLDEPTTGLHFDDLKKLLSVLHRLVDMGNTVICIEHNLDVIKTADWVIDLGPEAGEGGGLVVASGPPESIVKTSLSATGVALKPILKAGPVEKRDIHDASVEAEAEIGRHPTHDLDDAKMPWEVDGEAWHTINHLDSNGEPVNWDARVLLWLVASIRDSGKFAPTDWKHRTRVEITAVKNQPWFFHALTGFKDLLELSFRVPEKTFTESDLQSSLKVKTLDARKDLPIYGQWSRVRVRNLTGIAGGWDDIRISLRDQTDLTKPAFKKFLKQAATAYAKHLDNQQSNVELSKPWKALGQAWHLSQKSMSARQIAKWKPALLVSLVGRFKSLQPNLEFDWCSKTTVQLLEGETRRGKIVTNMGRGLRVELRAPNNVFTPTQVDKLGQDVEIKRRPDGDSIVFWVRSLDQVDTKQLRDVWKRSAPTGEAEERLQTA